MKTLWSKILFFIIACLALSGFLPSNIALISGFLFSLFFPLPYPKLSQYSINFLLKTAVIGLGFGMSVLETFQTSKSSFTLTLFCILLTLAFGYALSRWLKTEKTLSHLITSGTSICGGSAIAAISPIIKADSKTISMALAVIFFLNAIALIIFPILGHLLHLNEHQFGLWAAVAIHDTSSVVGATMHYGEEALKTGTAVKLSRTLWIIPLSVFSMAVFKTQNQSIKIPYFIILFLIAILINSYQLISSEWSHKIVVFSKHVLVLTLFLVGSTLSVSDLKKAGWKPITFATLLWAFVCIVSLTFILLTSA